MLETRPPTDRLRWLLERERPGPHAIAGHVAFTGHGRCWVDHPEQPAAVLLETAGNYLLAGVPDAVDPAWLRPVVTGFLAAEPAFTPLVAETFPAAGRWERVVFEWCPEREESVDPPSNIRPLRAEDTSALEGLSAPLRWIHRTWGGPAGLAASGYAWGAFDGARLAAVACTFFRGARYEEVGVVTEPAYRSRGLSTACVRALCADITARRRTPGWTTSPDNHASRRVAEKVGFRPAASDVLYVVNTEIPD